ncbi:17115_t:CDS:2, partial [Racocetra persica]
ITSEFATKKRRGAMMSLVFAMQGFGILFAGLITMLTLKVYESRIREDVRYLDHVWRIVVGVGAIPALGVLYFRVTNPESPRFTMDVLGNIDKGAKSVDILINNGSYTKDDKFEAFYLVGTPKASWKDFRVPGEVFPTRYRCLGHGISAASGKIGALLSQVMVLLLKDIGGKNMFFDRLLEIFALVCFIGFLFSFMIPETKCKSLEENSNEMQEGFIKTYIYPNLKQPNVIPLNEKQIRRNNDIS